MTEAHSDWVSLPVDATTKTGSSACSRSAPSSWRRAWSSQVSVGPLSASRVIRRPVGSGSSAWQVISPGPAAITASMAARAVPGTRTVTLYAGLALPTAAPAGPSAPPPPELLMPGTRAPAGAASRPAVTLASRATPESPVQHRKPVTVEARERTDQADLRPCRPVRALQTVPRPS
ncbi:hypothetical protein FAGKG844_140018 [Frankia sp. AgKG'84/4]